MHAPDTALFYAELTSVRKIRIQGCVVLNPSRTSWRIFRQFYGDGAREKRLILVEKSGDFLNPVSPLSRIIRGFITDTR